MTSGVPYWQDKTNHGQKRVAHWLATVVGEGGIYTVSRIRTEVVNHSQIDRRARELRQHFHWNIRNYRDEAGLKPGEHRLVEIGARIWEKSAAISTVKRLSATTRMTVLIDDKNRCRVCGIVPGQHYTGDPVDAPAARLTVGHVRLEGGDDRSNLRAECARCNEAVRDRTPPPPEVDSLRRSIHELGRADRERLARWIDNEAREFSKVEDLWARIQPLATPVRHDLRQYINDLTVPTDGKGSTAPG